VAALIAEVADLPATAEVKETVARPLGLDNYAQMLVASQVRRDAAEKRAKESEAKVEELEKEVADLRSEVMRLRAADQNVVAFKVKTPFKSDPDTGGPGGNS
jgi:hypothetical protein